MIFSFIRYVSPVWYFNLRPKIDHGYFPSRRQLEAAGISLEPDLAYESSEACSRDLAFRAFQLGFINEVGTEENDVWQPVKLPITDEYRFLRKNFSKVWVVYTLLIRLLGLKNPIIELAGFIKSKNAKRELYHNKHIRYSDYTSFESRLIASQPLVTVVIPTLNRYTYLKDVFRDLEKQTYKVFEVIVVDQSEPFEAQTYEGWNLDLKCWFQEEKALWKARNEAIQAANGNYFLLYDDDSRVAVDWIEQHLKALDFFKADLSSGVSISAVGAKVPEHYSYFRWSDQLDTGNVLVKRDVFEKIGLFDRQFEKQRMGDGEYGIRAYLAGYRNISNPFAKRTHLKVGEGGLRQMGSWDGWRPKKFFGPRPVPSILYFYRKYFGNTSAYLTLLKGIPPSIIPYQLKGSKLLMVLGSIVSLFLLPVILFQVITSWQKSSVMLAEGAKIKRI